MKSLYEFLGIIAIILGILVGGATIVAWHYNLKDCLVCFDTKGKRG